MSANRTTLSGFQKLPTEGDDTPAREVPKTTVVPDSREPDQSTAPEHSLAPPDHLPVQSSNPAPLDQAEPSLVEEARIGLDRADGVKESIDRSNTWEGAVGKIKWVMDTLSPVSEVRVMFVLPILD